LKKEFITHWSFESVMAKVTQMPIPRQRFFHRTARENSRVDTEIVIPDDITYDNLAFFVGRKTKVTIETIE
jgi:hypothetical protein